nr:DUF2497 domain-containing protein [Aerococcus urinae]
MSNQSPAQEPTMEEILASIRRIISEDSGGKDVAEEAPPVHHEEVYADAHTPAEESEEDVLFEDEEVLELTQPLPEPEHVHEHEPEPEPAHYEEPAAPQAPVHQAAHYEPEHEPEPEYAEPEEDIAFEEPAMSAPSRPAYQPQPAAQTSGLLSGDAATAASAAFGALASSMMTSAGGTGKTLEDLVADMLKPMLKQWLDQNLPSLVERLVAEEIERVARRGR